MSKRAPDAFRKQRWRKCMIYVAVPPGIAIGNPAFLPHRYSAVFLQTEQNVSNLSNIDHTGRRRGGKVKMLHVFHVDLGTVYTFEMELAMER